MVVGRIVSWEGDIMRRIGALSIGFLVKIFTLPHAIWCATYLGTYTAAHD